MSTLKEWTDTPCEGPDLANHICHKLGISDRKLEGSHYMCYCYVVIYYLRIYKPLKMYMSLKIRWHGCINVIMRNMSDLK